MVAETLVDGEKSRVTWGNPRVLDTTQSLGLFHLAEIEVGGEQEGLFFRSGVVGGAGRGVVGGEGGGGVGEEEGDLQHQRQDKYRGWEPVGRHHFLWLEKRKKD